MTTGKRGTAKGGTEGYTDARRLTHAVVSTGFGSCLIHGDRPSDFLSIRKEIDAHQADPCG